MASIVRTLWGSDVPLARWARLQRDIDDRFRQEPGRRQRVYVYGRNNADRITKAAKKTRSGQCKVILVNDDPWPDGRIDRMDGGQVIRPWHYKFQLLRQALMDHEDVIYCDWDVACLIGGEDEAFRWLRALEPFRLFLLSAYKYKRNRPRVGGDWEISGNWLYLRDHCFIDRVLAKMAEDGPGAWHDELTMSAVITDLCDRWPDDVTWLNNFESPIMCQKNYRSPWPLLSDDGLNVVRLTPVPFQWRRMFTQYGRK